jgi:hypothetical protein
MSNQAPGTEQRPKTPNPQGTKNQGPQDRSHSAQTEHSGKQKLPGSSQRPDQPHDSDPGTSEDQQKDRDQRGA